MHKLAAHFSFWNFAKEKSLGQLICMFATASRKNASRNISRNYYWILSLLGQDRAVGLDLSVVELRDSLP